MKRRRRWLHRGWLVLRSADRGQRWHRHGAWQSQYVFRLGFGIGQEDGRESCQMKLYGAIKRGGQACSQSYRVKTHSTISRLSLEEYGTSDMLASR